MISFRQLTPHDLPVVAGMGVSRLGTSMFSDPGEWQPGGDRTGWVALCDGVIVACSLACRRSKELLAIFVKPEFRGGRIGRELLRQAEAWLFSHGPDTIFADVTYGVPVEFLASHGWRTDKPIHERWLMKLSGKPVFSLEEHWIEDPATGYARLIRLSRGPANRKHPLCLVLDGEIYWRDIEAVPIFDRIAASMPSGMTIAYVGHVSALARHQDFTANENYARFIGECVVPWLQQEIAGLSEGGHAIVGLSLSGLMAVHLALRYPQLFNACVSQSGSHWWDYETFAETVKRHAPVQGRFWLSVGSQETKTNLHHPPTGLHQKVSQVDGVNNAVRLLREAGGVVNAHEFEGGHSWEYWRNELEEAVRWSLNVTPSARE